MFNIFRFLFSLQCIIGSFAILSDKPTYSFPPNMGWIIILGLLAIVFKEDKK